MHVLFARLAWGRVERDSRRSVVAENYVPLAHRVLGRAGALASDVLLLRRLPASCAPAQWHSVARIPCGGGGSRSSPLSLAGTP